MSPSVLVAVLTFRRRDDLLAILPMLQAEAARVARPVDIVVVDNDPEGGAAATVAGVPGVRYEHEPEPGIAAGRNRALRCAQDHDILIFIDDDERPSEGWLAALLATHEKYQRCGVVGPVVSDFATPLDPWVRAGGFFTRRRMPTGSDVVLAATNNLLLEMRAVRSAGITFDARLGLVGGSDTLFTRQLVAAAGPMVWCDEAIVTDVVPQARATRSWVVRRQLRNGNSWSTTALMLSQSRAQRLRLRAQFTATGLARVGVGALRWLYGTLRRDLGQQASGVKTAYRGFGLIVGAYGYRYEEYRRPDPSPAP